MAKIVCVLYPDPVSGYPPKYARDDIPVIDKYPNGQTVPSPEGKLGFTPGDLIGCVSGELGLREYLEANGHEFIVTSDKEGADSVLDRHLVDAERSTKRLSRCSRCVTWSTCKCPFTRRPRACSTTACLA